MKLKVEEIEKEREGRVWFVDGRKGGVEMDFSIRSMHITGMDLEVGDLIEVKIKKIKKKVAKKKK